MASINHACTPGVVKLKARHGRKVPEPCRPHIRKLGTSVAALAVDARSVQPRRSKQHRPAQRVMHLLKGRAVWRHLYPLRLTTPVDHTR